MTDMTPVAQTFKAIVAHVEGDVGSTDPSGAADAFAAAIAATIMPRRIDVSGGNGTRLGVIARNRRVLRVVEASPDDLWEGRDDSRDAGSDGFASAFALAVATLANHGEISIKTTLVDGNLPSNSFSGYPAARLAEDIKALGDAPVTDDLSTFYDAWSDYPRARSAEEIEIDLPNDAAVNADWMRTLISEWVEAMTDQESHLRFVITGGNTPMAIAFAAVAGAHCVVVSDDPETFDRLEAALAALSNHDREG